MMSVSLLHSPRLMQPYHQAAQLPPRPRRVALRSLAVARPQGPQPPPTPKPATAAQVDAMVEKITWMSREVPALTAAVAAGKLATHAGSTYANIIGAQTLVSRNIRVQDATLAVGLSIAGGMLQLFESRWAQALEKVCQNHVSTWLAAHPGGTTSEHHAQNASTYSTLDNLAYAQAWRLAGGAGVLGSLASSLYATFHNNPTPLSMPLFGVMLGLAVVRQGVDYWWTQRTQAERTRLNLQQSRDTYALVQAAAEDNPAALAHAQGDLETNRTGRYNLQRQNLGVGVVQDIVATVAYYAIMQQLGWFQPGTPSVDTLVGIQAAMTTARSLVNSVLTVPTFVMDVMQNRNRTRAYLTANAEDSNAPPA